MGCNNSHLRPFFRRCRRRSKKEDVTASTSNASTNATPKRQPTELTSLDSSSNHVENDSFLHNFQFIGSSSAKRDVAGASTSSSSDQPSCVPLLAQSEISHSQLDFFKMLDDKIQEGPDYDSEEDRVDTELLIKRNIETWTRTIAHVNANSSSSKPNNASRNNASSSIVGGRSQSYHGKAAAASTTSSNHRPGSSSSGTTTTKYISSRYQWGDEGDGG